MNRVATIRALLAAGCGVCIDAGRVAADPDPKSILASLSGV